MQTFFSSATLANGLHARMPEIRENLTRSKKAARAEILGQFESTANVVSFIANVGHIHLIQAGADLVMAERKISGNDISWPGLEAATLVCFRFGAVISGLANLSATLDSPVADIKEAEMQIGDTLTHLSDEGNFIPSRSAVHKVLQKFGDVPKPIIGMLERLFPEPVRMDKDGPTYVTSAQLH